MEQIARRLAPEEPAAKRARPASVDILTLMKAKGPRCAPLHCLQLKAPVP